MLLRLAILFHPYLSPISWKEARNSAMAAQITRLLYKKQVVDLE